MPGFHSDTEKQAHVRLILEQRAKLVEEAGLVCMLAHLANLGELTRIFEWQRAQERDAFTECRRREQVEARFSTDREQAQVLRTAPRPHAICIVRKEGRRAARDKPLVEDDLYLNDARPSLVAYPRLEQTCTICLGLKSHPVPLLRLHSVSLETSWECPDCQGKNITRRPVPHKEEEATIARDYFAGWDNSKVNYTWAGLSFPRPTYGDDSD
ncbi:hypothetical protein B0H19DRAFT_1256590 [Mycena capillaripes]|nr:hypothetical protein B0H19DRAFT_1256590 [Mycena capillaripes]